MNDKLKLKYSVLHPVIFVLLLWVIRDFERLWDVDFARYGVFPKTVSGLVGILTSPLIHGDIFHLLSNTFPLLILGTMLYYFYEKIANKTVLIIYLLSGVLVWFFGRPSYHIGASGLVYGIASFLFFSGFFRKNRESLSISFAIIFLYGGLVYGILPTDENISYESHFFGGLVGMAASFYFRKIPIFRKQLSKDATPDFRQTNTDYNYQYIPTHFKQNTSSLVMVRPLHFGFNLETSSSNVFQNTNELASDKDIEKKAIEEFDIFSTKLKSVGINIFVFEDQHNKKLPDSVFPNNWISMHQDGKVITYPMLSEARRKERREDIIDILTHKFQFTVNEKISLEEFENSDQFLEGTGSVIFDHINKKAYGNISKRTNRALFEKISKKLNYQAYLFDACNSKGEEIYHTNVILSIGEHFAVISSSSIPNVNQRNEILNSLQKDKKFVLDLSEEQVYNFCGNILQVENVYGMKYIVMSSRAFVNFTPDQLQILKMNGEIIHSDLTTIENYGGGSARCMLAEVFLPKT